MALGRPVTQIRRSHMQPIALTRPPAFPNIAVTLPICNGGEDVNGGNKMNRRELAGVIVGAATLAIPGYALGAPAAGKPILIGAHLDLAKQASYYSLLQRDAINLFVADLNAAGGIGGRPVQVLFEDDENNPVTAVTKVDKFASEGVDYIVSVGSSATGLAAQARAEELKIPIGAPANLAEKLTSDPPKRYYFRIPLRGKYEIAAVAQYLRKKYGAPKLAVVRDTTQTGLVLSDQWVHDLKQDGFKIVAVEQITPGSTEASSQALRVKDFRRRRRHRDGRIDTRSCELHQSPQAV